jgi:hypothetical protein
VRLRAWSETDCSARRARAWAKCESARASLCLLCLSSESPFTLSVLFRSPTAHRHFLLRSAANSTNAKEKVRGNCGGTSGATRKSATLFRSSRSRSHGNKVWPQLRDKSDRRTRSFGWHRFLSGSKPPTIWDDKYACAPTSGQRSARSCLATNPKVMFVCGYEGDQKVKTRIDWSVGLSNERESDREARVSNCQSVATLSHPLLPLSTAIAQSLTMFRIAF